MVKSIWGTDVNIDIFIEANKNKCEYVDKIDARIWDIEGIANILKEFNGVIGKLPYPLNILETNMKYMLIKDTIKSKIDKEMTVGNKALYIKVKDNEYLELRSNQYLISDTNYDLSEDECKGEIAYEQFKYLRDHKDGYKKYYVNYMGNLVSLCRKFKENNVKLTDELEAQLKNMLNLIDVPDCIREKLSYNNLIDFENNIKYYIDVYCTGNKEIKSKTSVISIVGGKCKIMDDKKEVKKLWGYSSYVKIGDTDIKNFEQITENKSGLISVFQSMIGCDTFEIKGVIIGKKIIYELGRNLICCDLEEYDRDEPYHTITSNGKIYSVDSRYVYIECQRKIENRVIEKRILRLDPEGNTIEVCKIEFIRY